MRFSAQFEPVVKNRRILQPHRHPLTDFHGELAVRLACALAGDYGFKLALEIQHGRTQSFVIRPATKMTHPVDCGGRSIEVEFFRRKQSFRAPANVRVENIGMR